MKYALIILNAYPSVCLTHISCQQCKPYHKYYQDESDEEESTAYKQPIIEMGDASNPNPKIIEVSNKIKKKRKRWRRHDVRPRRWVLQEKSEFFDRIRKRKQRGNAGTGGDDDDDEQGISNQYHGVAEANASKYVILSVAPPQTEATYRVYMDTTSPPTTVASETISVQPIHGFHTFSQPYKFASLTMEEAESAIEKQRNVVTRYMMHGKLASQNNSNEGRAALASGVAAVGVGGGRGSRALNRPIGPAPKAMSRARLLGKLAGGGDEDDDVMADVRYSSSKGSGRARKELLTTLGDEGVTVDEDGVLGGANDSEFGGRRRFGRVNVNKDADGDAKKGGKGEGAKTSTGFEAGAMEEGFYQRDVAAEYEALDYDANEQFDDDDVNVGEDEMMDDGGGYGGDFHDSGDDMLDSDDDEAGSDDDGFKGMATSSGFKSMLAKARGESPVTATSGGTDNNGGNDMLDASMKSISDSGPDGGKGIDRMLDAAKKTADAAKSSPEDKKSLETEKIKAMGIEKDKDGKRLITLDAVRREIWLNNGAITSKRLTKKFDVTKKNPERQALFKTIVMELCTIKKDADGNKLVLKQHYAKI